MPTDSEPDIFGDEEEDLGTCPYFARHESLPGHDPEAVCSFGCWDEPQCITCCPLEGWSSQRRKPLPRKLPRNKHALKLKQK